MKPIDFVKALRTNRHIVADEYCSHKHVHKRLPYLTAEVALMLGLPECDRRKVSPTGRDLTDWVDLAVVNTLLVDELEPVTFTKWRNDGWQLDEDDEWQGS